ncbi:MAG: hypothetical protein DMF89_23635 [Acidobacteria bacterium]|nr:MAG: hypothetical protein DMF89_23635 [Acidobacteriota bacterium]
MIDGTLIQGLYGAIRSIKVKSALNPLLWLCVITIPCYSAAIFLREFSGERIALLCVGSLPIVAAVFIAIYWAIKKPALLQSEHFQLMEQSLRMLQGQRLHETVSPEAVVALMNPTPPPLQISSGSGAQPSAGSGAQLQMSADSGAPGE